MNDTPLRPTDVQAALDRLDGRLDELTDLFRRRLLDDRDKRRLLDAATDRAKAAELGPFRQHLQPLVVGIAMVIDRIDAYRGTDSEFVASIRDELFDVLGRHGVTAIDTHGPIDPSRHEVVSVAGAGLHRAGRDMVVAAVESRGYQHGGWVFRPARVVAQPADVTEKASTSEV